MSSNEKKLSETKIKDIFLKYDQNKDHKLGEKELHSLMTDLFKETNNLNKMEQDNHKIIEEIVREIKQIQDKNKDGKLEFKEILAYFEKKNILMKSHSKSLIYKNL